MDEHPIQSLIKTSMESIKEMVDVNTIVGDAVGTADGSVIIRFLGFVLDLRQVAVNLMLRLQKIMIKAKNPSCLLEVAAVPEYRFNRWHSW